MRHQRLQGAERIPTDKDDHGEKTDGDSHGNDSIKIMVRYSDSEWQNVPGVKKRLLDTHPQITELSIIQVSTLRKFGDYLTPSDAERTAMFRRVHHVIFICIILREIDVPRGNLPWICDNRRTIQAAPQVGFGRRKRRNRNTVGVR